MSAPEPSRSGAADGPRDRQSWAGYLQRFHQQRPGITDDILAASTSDGINAYQWLLEPFPDRARLLDIACGNAPLHRLTAPAGWWVGIDRSEAELARAATQGAGPLVRAEASSLPFASHSVEAVACSMALMLVQPIDAALKEMHRVIRPGGLAAMTIPGTWPLTAADLWRYSRLMAVLRLTHLAYPNDRPLRRAGHLLRRHGFDVADDRRRRFIYTPSSAEAARMFVRSLYLPGVPDSRVARAESMAARWAGHPVGIPLRRLVLRAR